MNIAFFSIYTTNIFLFAQFIYWSNFANTVLRNKIYKRVIFAAPPCSPVCLFYYIFNLLFNLLWEKVLAFQGYNLRRPLWLSCLNLITILNAYNFFLNCKFLSDSQSSASLPTRWPNPLAPTQTSRAALADSVSSDSEIISQTLPHSFYMTCAKPRVSKLSGPWAMLQ